MITAEKIKQVKKRLRKGEPEGEIKNELRKEGYTEEEMAQIFVVHKPDMRSWYLFFAVLFLLIGIYRMITNESFLFLLFSAGMFYVYWIELKRIEKSA
jgi:hypothetical protein